jgi:hypothetical protein
VIAAGVAVGQIIQPDNCVPIAVVLVDDCASAEEGINSTLCSEAATPVATLAFKNFRRVGFFN